MQYQILQKYLPVNCFTAGFSFRAAVIENQFTSSNQPALRIQVLHVIKPLFEECNEE